MTIRNKNLDINHLRQSPFQMLFNSQQWWHQGGWGISPIGGSASNCPPPPHQKKKMAKISNFWIFCILPPRCPPPQTFLVPSLIPIRSVLGSAVFDLPPACLHIMQATFDSVQINFHNFVPAHVQEEF